jgi:hypothetical protein
LSPVQICWTIDFRRSENSSATTRFWFEIGDDLPRPAQVAARENRSRFLLSI